jgi:hypothetical protein
MHSECTAVFLGLWFFLDSLVIVGMITQEDKNASAYEYLTNQVWAFVLFSKLCFVYALYNREDFSKDKTKIQTMWFMNANFVASGTAQAGIMMTFFVLAYQDCTLLTGIVAEGVAISDVLIWNHLRHVTVCFLHLLIYISERRFISRVANECLRLKTTDPLDLMFAYVIIIPVVIGVLHSCFFDDSHIYRFQESAVGRHCMIAFGLSVVVASAYYVYGPIRSTYNEAQHPFALGLAIEMDLILETRKTILI